MQYCAQELDDLSFDETRQTNVTEDFGEEEAVDVGGLQIKPLATSSTKRPRERPTVTFADTEIM